MQAHSQCHSSLSPLFRRSLFVSHTSLNKNNLFVLSEVDVASFAIYVSLMDYGSFTGVEVSIGFLILIRETENEASATHFLRYHEGI